MTTGLGTCYHTGAYVAERASSTRHPHQPGDALNPKHIALLGDSFDKLLSIMSRHGYHAYRVVNDDYASTYPPALRQPATLIRWRGLVDSETDLIFSRINAESLP